MNVKLGNFSQCERNCKFRRYQYFPIPIDPCVEEIWLSMVQWVLKGKGKDHFCVRVPRFLDLEVEVVQNRVWVGKVFVIAYLKARNILIRKIYWTNLTWWRFRASCNFSMNNDHERHHIFQKVQLCIGIGWRCYTPPTYFFIPWINHNETFIG